MKYNPTQRKQDIMEFLQKNRRIPSWYSEDATERKLANSLSYYRYGSDIHVLIESLCEEKRSIEKSELIAFIKTNGRRPQLHSEPTLNGRLYRYMNPKAVSYDREFAKLVRELAPKFVVPKPNKKALVLEFLETHRRRPKKSNPEEYVLGNALFSYISPSSKIFDPKFTNQVRQLERVFQKEGVK